ncbi:5682_t:CDS:2, partial [Acaulospora colombiana]
MAKAEIEQDGQGKKAKAEPAFRYTRLDEWHPPLETLLAHDELAWGEVKNPVAVTPTPITPALALFLTVPPLVIVALPNLILSLPLNTFDPVPIILGSVGNGSFSIEMMLRVLGTPVGPLLP